MGNQSMQAIMSRLPGYQQQAQAIGRPQYAPQQVGRPTAQQTMTRPQRPQRPVGMQQPQRAPGVPSGPIQQGQQRAMPRQRGVSMGGGWKPGDRALEGGMRVSQAQWDAAPEWARRQGRPDPMANRGTISALRRAWGKDQTKWEQENWKNAMLGRGPKSYAEHKGWENGQPPDPWANDLNAGG